MRYFCSSAMIANMGKKEIVMTEAIIHLINLISSSLSLIISINNSNKWSYSFHKYKIRNMNKDH